MNWIGRKIHLYNVTIGLYMLDWWERYLFIKGAMLHVLPGDFELAMPSSTNAGVHIPSFATLPSQYTGNFGKQYNDILMVCLFWYILGYLLGFFQSNVKTLFQEGNYLGHGST